MAANDEQLPAYLTRGRRRAARRRFLAGGGSALAALASAPMLGAAAPRAAAHTTSTGTGASETDAGPGAGDEKIQLPHTAAAPVGGPMSGFDATPPAPPAGP